MKIKIKNKTHTKVDIKSADDICMYSLNILILSSLYPTPNSGSSKTRS